MLLETTYTGEHKARIISSEDRMCKSCKNLKSGETINCSEDDYHVFFGTFFTDELLQTARTNALSH